MASYRFARRSSALIVLIGLCSLAATYIQANPLLFPTDSDRDLERQVGQYLTDEKDLNVTYRYLDADENDLITEVSFRSEGYPPIKFIIDTAVSGRNDAGEAIETRVTVVAIFIYEVDENHPKRSETIEVLNRVHKDKWMPQRAYLDSDGDLRLENHLNIPSTTTPVHAEMVFDVIARVSNEWKTIHDSLKAIGLEPK